MKLYFDSLTTLKVIHAESPIVIFFGTYGILNVSIVKHIVEAWFKKKNWTLMSLLDYAMNQQTATKTKEIIYLWLKITIKK